MKLSDDMKNLVRSNTEYSQMFNLLGITMNEIIKQIRLTLANIKEYPIRYRNMELNQYSLPKEQIRKRVEDPELDKFEKEPISGAQCNEKTLDMLEINSYFKRQSWIEYFELFKVIEPEVNSILAIFNPNTFPKKVCANQSGETCNDEL